MLRPLVVFIHYTSTKYSHEDLCNSITTPQCIELQISHPSSATHSWSYYFSCHLLLSMPRFKLNLCWLKGHQRQYNTFSMATQNPEARAHFSIAVDLKRFAAYSLRFIRCVICACDCLCGDCKSRESAKRSIYWDNCGLLGHPGTT